MATADIFVAELEAKNGTSFQRLLAGFVDLRAKENLAPADLLRLEQKAIVEATEVAALWLCDTDSVAHKMELASQCGDGARQFDVMGNRLLELGVDTAAFDPRHGGYTKLFAFFRSLGTTEERAAGAVLTLRAFNVLRRSAAADSCNQKGDTETARILRDVMASDDAQHIDAGRRALIDVAVNEESQARARRSAFRTIELIGESWDPVGVRKFLSRSLAKK